MGSDEKCNLTGRRCWRLDYQQDICSTAPSLEDAARCIEALDQQNTELRDELDAMDRWVEKLRVEAKDIRPVVTAH
jgi:predicted RNase H-like nuclease (RuvC/YqgF family)